MAGKGGLAIMIGLGKKKPGAAMDSEDESGDGSESAEDEAFQAAADAAKSGDGAAFKDAMKTAMELCYPSLAKSSYSEGESEEEG